MDPEPGWYPDVQRPGQKRWWNGVVWTSHRRPTDGPDDPPPPDPRDAVSPNAATQEGWRAGQMPGAAPLPRATTSGLAIASLAFGILWIFGVGSVIGLVLGFLALRRIKRARGLIGGRLIAMLGIAVSASTLVATIVLLANFDQAVEELKETVVAEATNDDLRAAADAMQDHRDRTGSWATQIGALADVGYRPAPDVTMVIARTTTLSFCLEALHVDDDTVRHLVLGQEPATGRCP